MLDREVEKRSCDLISINKGRRTAKRSDSRKDKESLMQENDLKKEMNLGEDAELQTAQEEPPELPDQSLSD